MLGPIVDRELTTLSRRRGCYGGRIVVPATMLAILWGNYAGWQYLNGGPRTVQQAAWFGRLTFLQLAIAQMLVTMQAVTGFVTRTIGEEKDRKTLTFLLSTPLSSRSIVLGKLAVGLMHYVSCLVAGLPVVLLLPFFGGVEPELVLLSYAGTVSVAIFLGGLSLAVAVGSRRSREAQRITMALVPIWLIGPIVMVFLGPKIVPRLYPWIRPLNEILVASTPLSIPLTASTWMSRGTFPQVVSRMIGLQLGAAVLLIIGSTLTLRPAWRRHEDRGGGRLARRIGRWRLWRRPECGDRPILWKELHAEGARGIPWIVFRLLFLALAVMLAVGTYSAGRNAFDEVLASGYLVMNDSPGRSFFNLYLRIITAAISMIYALTVTGIAAEGIATERVRDTWPGLIATVLEGPEIVRDKMIGALWRTRGLALLLVALWATGVLAGGVHPLGASATVVCLASWSWFFTALGTYASLRARSIAGATNASVLPVLLIGFSGLLPTSMPESMRSILCGAASFPLVESLAMTSYREVYPSLSLSTGAIGMTTGEGTPMVLITFALNVLGAAGGAVFLTRLANRQFDRLVGRPYRAVPRAAGETGGDEGRRSAPPVAAVAKAVL